MPLDVMSAGRTSEEAGKAPDKAAHLFLVTAANIFTLEKVPEEAGCEFKEERWISPSWAAIEKHSATLGA
jgi:hypothetical protein